MRCLTPEQIDRLALRPDDASLAKQRDHVERCYACRRALAEAVHDSGMVRDIRELRETRRAVAPLADSMPSPTENP